MENSTNHHKKIKILFICKNRNMPYGYGGSYGLLNSCRFVGEALEEKFPNNFEFKVVSVIDNNGIDKEVHNYKPTHVMIEALWVVPSKFDVLLPLYPDVKWVVRIHSKAPFIANEGIAFNWLIQYEQLKSKYSNFNVATNDCEFSIDLDQALNVKFLYLPNIYLVNKKFVISYNPDCDLINIGCFGALRPLKNQLQQAIAAIIFADDLDKKLAFHMNGTRMEQNGDSVLENIKSLFAANPKHELVLHDWVNHKEFMELVKSMDIGMQLSFSESFNIVAADFVKNNIPMVVSDDIAWASRLYKTSTTDTNHIVDKLKFAFKFRKFGLQYFNKISLYDYNIKAVSAWAHYLHI